MGIDIVLKGACVHFILQIYAARGVVVAARGIVVAVRGVNVVTIRG